MIKIFGSSTVGVLCGVFGLKHVKEQNETIQRLKEENEIQKQEITYLKLKLETLIDLNEDEMYITFNNGFDKMMADKRNQIEKARKKFDILESEISKLNRKNHKAVGKILDKLSRLSD